AISLYAYPKRVWRGEVFEIHPDADRAKKTFLTKVRFVELPPALRSGMSAEINVIAEERPGALLAPSDAIDAGGGAWVVRGGRAQHITVKTGVRDMLRVEITSGLAEGEPLIIEGATGLTEGSRVAATERPADASAPMPGKGVVSDGTHL
ncbi:MAG: efflux RND transporter periplasmic adaptor subunit, partial [Polyangiales bacterium]